MKKIIYLIIFLAGFSFLIYEVSWNRYLSLILGTTVTASTIVLTAFMAGFGIGALILGNLANNYKKPNKLLAVLLAAIGIFSLLNFFIISELTSFLNLFISSYSTSNLMFFAISFVLLLIPAFFMGGIIPLVNKIVISDTTNFSKKLGTIYAFETLGSTLGGLFAGFILLGNIGQKETIYVAVLINIIIAIYLFFTKQFKQVSIVSDKPKNTENIVGNTSESAKVALISTLIIGFAMLALQIVWMRIFKTYFTNTSYTFTLITTFVIFGLAIGSWLYKKYGDSVKNSNVAMLRVLILLAVFSLLGLLVLIKLPELLLFPFKTIMANAFVRLIIIPSVASFLIVIPPAIVSGFAFPLAFKMYSTGINNLSKRVGRVLLFNTIGSVIGPVSATFILIPYVGVGKSVIIIAILLLLVSIYVSILIKSYPKIQLYKNTIIVKVVLLFIIMVSINQIRFVPPSIKKFNKKILFYEETIDGTIIVVDEKQKGVFGKSTFVNNSSVIGSNYDAVKVVKMVGHIPFFSNLKCENVLVVGFGIGVTTSAIASHPEVKKIDCIELAPNLVKAAKYYQEFNYGVYNDKRLNLISGDGRHFLKVTQNKYDLISCDPTHPVLGSANLYTKEYFEECYQHLTSSGMISQYLPLHKLRQEDLLGIIKTFNSVFANSTVWLGQYHAILLGRKGNEKIDFSIWKQKIEQMPKDDFFYLEPYHIAANVILSDKEISNFPKNIQINNDNLSYTEFFSFDCFDSSNLYNNLEYLTSYRCNIDDVFTKIDDKDKMNRFIAGNKKLTKSIYFSLKKDYKKALHELRLARDINVEDQEYPFLIQFYYGVKR